jgi:hypothetical protein
MSKAIHVSETNCIKFQRDASDRFSMLSQISRGKKNNKRGTTPSAIANQTPPTVHMI